MRNERETAVADLRLSVYLRPLHPEFFTIRAQRAFPSASGGFEAAVWLLGPGHVITFVDGEEAVTEVVAPRDLVLPKRGLARQFDLAGEREERFEARGPITYQVAYLVDAENPETYLRETEELLAAARQTEGGQARRTEGGQARQGHLLAEDSSVSSDPAGRAFSYAVPELSARSLLVHAWHAFPAENTILKTQTLIERSRL